MFESAKLKIVRANQHLCDFETRFAEYVATKPHRFSIHNDPKNGQPKIRIRFEIDRTKTFSLVVGDAIHNLRASLDHLTWEAIGLDGGTQNRYTKLPTGNNRVDYESACKGIETPSNWVKDLFISLEIFPGGRGDGIYALNELNNTDKHTVLPLMVKATTHPAFTIYGPTGTPMIRMEGNTIASSSTDFITLANIPPGHSCELDDDAQCAPAIFFKDVDRPGQPVIPTLKQFSQLAVGVIEVFETHFR